MSLRLSVGVTPLALALVAGCGTSSSDAPSGNQGPEPPQTEDREPPPVEPATAEALRALLAPVPGAPPEDLLGRGIHSRTSTLAERCASWSSELHLAVGSAGIKGSSGPALPMMPHANVLSGDPIAIDLRDKEAAFRLSLPAPRKAAVAWTSQLMTDSLQPRGNFELTDTAREHDSQGAETFAQHCGDRFVLSLGIGGELIVVAIVDMDAMDEDPSDVRWASGFRAYIEGDPDTLLPVSRHVFHVGGGEWATDPSTLGPEELVALMTEFLTLAKEFPAPIFSYPDRYEMAGHHVGDPSE